MTKPAENSRSEGGSKIDTPPVLPDRGAFGLFALPTFDAGLIPVPTVLEGKSKKPMVNGFQTRRFRRQTIEGFANGEQGKYELGIATGGQSGVFVVDVDVDEDGLCPDLPRMIEMFGEPVVMVRTPSGGYHLYYKWTDELSANWRPDFNVDIRAHGTYVAFPPSRRSDGRAYKFVRGGLADMAKLKPPLPVKRL